MNVRTAKLDILRRGADERHKAELARVRGERDRLFDRLVDNDQDSERELKPGGVPFEQSLTWILEQMSTSRDIDPDIAAALAEHDRQFSDPDRPAGAAPASPD